MPQRPASTADLPTLDVLTVGHALMDVLAMVSDDVIDRFGLVKGTVRLIDEAEAERLGEVVEPMALVSGGSAVNTAVGVASLGGRAGSLARVADDPLGRLYAEDLVRAGVVYPARPADGGAGTGRCLILVTPDGERTMNTYLGAGANLGPEDVDDGLVQRAAVVYFEGYLLDSPSAVAAMKAVIAGTHRVGGTVAISLSDPFCVQRHRQTLLDLVTGPPGTGADLVFANEEEACLLWGTEHIDEAVEALRGTGRMAAVTRGPAGSVAVAGEETVRVPAEPVEQVVDTTGAGDLYAAGVLYGITHGCTLEAAVRLGGLAAAEVISHLGARPQRPLQTLARAAGLVS